MHRAGEMSFSLCLQSCLGLDLEWSLTKATALFHAGMLEYLGEVRVAVDMLNGFQWICCMCCRGYVAWVSVDLLHVLPCISTAKHATNPLDLHGFLHGFDKILC